MSCDPHEGFPGSAGGKDPPVNAVDMRDSKV